MLSTGEIRFHHTDSVPPYVSKSEHRHIRANLHSFLPTPVLMHSRSVSVWFVSDYVPTCKRPVPICPMSPDKHSLSRRVLTHSLYHRPLSRCKNPTLHIRKQRKATVTGAGGIIAEFYPISTLNRIYFGGNVADIAKEGSEIKGVLFRWPEMLRGWSELVIGTIY